jgi:hypothetical protein
VTLKLEQLLAVLLYEAGGGGTSNKVRVTQHILQEGDVGLNATYLKETA